MSVAAVQKAISERVEESLEALKDESQDSVLSETRKSQVNELGTQEKENIQIVQIFQSALKEARTQVDKEQILELLRDGEYIERLGSILPVVRGAIDETIQMQLNWFAFQGDAHDLNWLNEVKAICGPDLMSSVARAQKEIVARDLGELLAFFKLNDEQFIASIEATIVNCNNVNHPALRNIFQASSFDDVVSVFKEIQTLLQSRFNGTEITEWLETSVPNFKGDTVVEAFLGGRVLQVLYYLRKIEERVFE